MKIGSLRLKDIWLRYCRTLNQPEEAVRPTMNDIIVTMNSLILKGTTFFAVIFDETQRLATRNKKRNKLVAKNNLILEKRLIRKICEKPKASNQRKSVYNPAKAEIEIISAKIIPRMILMNMFFFIIEDNYLWLLLNFAIQMSFSNNSN